MGFGSDSFGSGPFGATNWAMQVLFDLYPEVYRRLDVENGNLLREWSAGIGAKYQEFRKKIQNFSDLRDPNAIPTKYTGSVSVKLGRVIGTAGTILQAGLFGSVDASGTFTARTARFTEQDIGRTLALTSTSTTSLNNASFQIASIVDPSSVALDSPPVAESNLTWQVRDRVPSSDQLTIEVWQGDVSEVVPGSTLFDGTTEFTVLSRTQFPVPGSTDPFTERYGADGFFWVPSDIPTITVFASASGAFSVADVGKIISLPAEGDQENRVLSRIESVVISVDSTLSGKTAVTLVPVDLTVVPDVLDNATPLTSSATPSSPIYWALLPRPTITISGRTIPAGVVAAYGYSGSFDGVVTAGQGPTLTDTARPLFSASMVGNTVNVTIPRAAASATTYSYRSSVKSYVSPSAVVLTPPNVISGVQTTVLYEVRTPSGLGDSSTVRIFQPSTIEFLAEELGVKLSRAESDERQRGLVRNVLQWADRKGQKDSYRILGALSGWNVTADQLHRINLQKAAGLTVPSTEYVEDRLTDTGTLGSNGRLSYVSGRVAFSSVTADFDTSHVGFNLKISGASTAAKNKYYTITAILSPTQVQLASNDVVPSEFGPVPDVSDGSLGWYLTRLYTKKLPKLAVLDEFNYDLLTNDVQGYFSVPDQYDWQNATTYPALTNDGKIYIDVTAVSQFSKNQWTVTAKAAQVGLIDESIPIQVNETLTSSGGGSGVFRLRGSSFQAGTYRADVLSSSNQLFLLTGDAVTGSGGGAGVITAGPVDSAEVISTVGNWYILDSVGTQFWIETLPVLQNAGLTNLIAKNPGFENDANGDGLADYWRSYNNTSGLEPSTMSLVPGVFGGVAQRITWSVNNTSSKGVNTSNNVSVNGGGVTGAWQPNTTYVVSFWAKATGTNLGQTMAMGWNVFPTTTPLLNPGLKTTWQQYALRIAWAGTVDTTNGGGSLWLTITNNSLTNGTLDIDEVRVEQTSTFTSLYPATYTFNVATYTAPVVGIATLGYDAPVLPVDGLTPDSAALLTLQQQIAVDAPIAADANALVVYRMDESSPTAPLTDASGHINLPFNATGAVPSVKGLVSGARYFSGYSAVSSNGPAFFSSSLSAGQQSLLTGAFGSGNWTFETLLWIDPAVTGTTFPGPGGSAGLVSIRASGGTTYVFLPRLNNSTGGFDLWHGTGFSCNGPNWSNYARGTWHGLAVRATQTSATACKIDWFVDGVLKSTTTNITIPTFANVTSFWVGGESSTQNCFFGALDELRISNVARSDQEISSYFAYTIGQTELLNRLEDVTPIHTRTIVKVVT
jgi:hypothetical protein